MRSKGHVDYYADPNNNGDTIKPSEYHTVDIGTEAFTKFVAGQSAMTNGGAFGGKRHGPLSQYSQNPGALWTCSVCTVLLPPPVEWWFLLLLCTIHMWFVLGTATFSLKVGCADSVCVVL